MTTPKQVQLTVANDKPAKHNVPAATFPQLSTTEGIVGIEGEQGGFDLFALGGVSVVRFFGEQGVDPLTVRHDVGRNRQGGQVAVSGHVVQRLVMQLIGVEEGLQAG